MKTRACGWNGCKTIIDKINLRTNRPFYYCGLHTKLRKKHKDKYYMKTQEEYNRDTLERYHALRKQVLDLYGAICNCCGEHEVKFLALDHVQGDGCKHRKDRGGSYGVYKDALSQYDPDKFQILCHNCNMARSLYGECPHKLAMEINHGQ